MANFIDPICYTFFFSAITDQVCEPDFVRIFRKLLLPCKEGIKQIFRIDAPDETMNACSSSKMIIANVNQQLDGRYFSKAKHSLDHFEDSWNYILSNLHDDQTYNIELHTDEKNSRKYFCQRKTPLGKEFEQLFDNWKGVKAQNPPCTYQEYLEANIDRVCNLLNCPNDTLDGVLIPKKCLNNDLFGISYKTRKHDMKLFGDYGNGSSDYQLLGLDPEGKYYEHRLAFRLPRYAFGMGNEIASMQQQWCAALKELGNLFPIAYGSIAMDYPPNQYHPIFSCFDMNGFLSFPLYLSKYIPGYAWGMVLNKMQTSLIENLDELKSDSCFYHIEKLENGSHYFQMTPDVRKMKKEEALFLRRTFEPFLPYHNLWITIDFIDFSFRMGCTKENLSFSTPFKRTQLLCVHPLKAYVNPHSDKYSH